jgi:hypothetical protein
LELLFLNRLALLHISILIRDEWGRQAGFFCRQDSRRVYPPFSITIIIIIIIMIIISTGNVEVKVIPVIRGATGPIFQNHSDNTWTTYQGSKKLRK